MPDSGAILHVSGLGEVKTTSVIMMMRGTAMVMMPGTVIMMMQDITQVQDAEDNQDESM